MRDPSPIYTIAIDANPFGVRAALVEDGMLLVDAIEAKPDHLGPVANFVARYQSRFPDIVILGSPRDTWPIDFKDLLDGLTVPRVWLSWKAAKTLHWEWAPWQRRRRLLRARFLAYLNQDIIYNMSAQAAILEWEAIVARETLKEVEAAAKQLRLYVHTQ